MPDKPFTRPRAPESQADPKTDDLEKKRSRARRTMKNPTGQPDDRETLPLRTPPPGLRGDVYKSSDRAPAKNEVLLAQALSPLRECIALGGTRRQRVMRARARTVNSKKRLSGFECHVTLREMCVSTEKV